MRLFFLYIVMSCFIFSCACDTGYKSINENYYLMWVDSFDIMSLCYENNKIDKRIINPSVFAIALSNEYILVKQHPAKFMINPTNPIDTTITNYFIVKVLGENTNNPEKGVLGPYSKSAFHMKIKELNINEISFENTY
jgi:hypothetical protein